MADTIDFGKVKQGSQPTLTFVWPLPTSPAHTPDDLDGFTITGVMQNIDTGDVTAISSGAVTVTTGATRTCAWEMGSTDTGTAGSFLVVLTATDGTDTIKTLNGSIYIEADPSVTAIAGESLEGVPTSDAAWLATSASGGALGTAAYAATGDFDAAGDAAAAQAAAIAALGGADGTVTDEQLRNWASQAAALLTSTTRTDYSKSWTGTDGAAKYAGWVQVTATITWPDGVTGHLDGVEYPEAPGVLQYFTASHLASGKIVVQSPLVDGVAGVTVVTPDYYVDSGAAAGGDGSLAMPFDTISDLGTIAEGAVVALKSGSEWREQITIENDDISIYRYGAGNKPILRCDDVQANASFTKTGGYTNLYNKTLSTNYQSGYPGIVKAYEDDTDLTWAADLATCDSTPGSFHVPVSNSVSPELYIHASDSSDVTANGKAYDATVRNSAVFSDNSQNRTVVDGIAGKRNYSESGSFRIYTDSVIRHCYAADGGKHSVFIGPGAAAYGCDAHNAYGASSSSPTLYVFNTGTPSGEDVSFYDCVARADSAGNVLTGYYGHYNTSGNFGDVIFSRCVAKTLTLGFLRGLIGTTGTFTTRQCIVDGCSVGYRLQAGNTTLWTVDQCYQYETATITRTFEILLANSVFAIKNCYFKVPSTTSTGIVYASVASTLTFENNYVEFTNSIGAGRNGIYNTAAMGVIAINNHMVQAGDNGFWVYLTNGSSTLTSERNRFSRLGIFFNVGGSLGNVEAAQAAGYDTTSIIA